MKRQVVIGLEIHLQLKTRSKLFCSCSTDYVGAIPNTNVCPICLAVPGTLPLLNELAVEQAVKLGLALHCNIQDQTRFYRKHYFYADLPKAYQVTQYDHPIAMGGYLDILVEGKEKRVHLDHLHLEEDAGKLVHQTADGRLSGASHSFVDYNRGGMPLSEIVSKPEINSSAEAVAYITQIRQLARYLKVSDGEMESGSLRVDVNVSLSKDDGSLGTRVEIKNINSLKSIERALEFEIARQNRILDEGEALIQETRLWDDAVGVTRSMRGKENANDYRYFLEMDLAPINADIEYVEKIRHTLTEMPWDKRNRIVEKYKISFEESLLLTEQKELADYFEDCVKNGASAARTSNWIRTEVLRVLRDQKIDISNFPIASKDLATLIKKIDKKEISNTLAKDVMSAMLEKNMGLDKALHDCGGDSGRVTGVNLQLVINKIIETEPEAAEVVRSGQDKKGAKIKYLQGLVMRETRGSADHQEVIDILKRTLE
ncbi:MAG: Asp-tRNA(Asn)/Glu-tRNA(Gln) amidotransferase subunit GatB [Synergistaceae bacterium]|jgi:aspartyl-tRNA(Asn)/glutamyl-tRNA(Gln) amidotransferase subunit B|nr:Asp-tRNA(Asn)/Glu-tRNA(Gln) amidotransferase subunit GatB [Synergistaceae bacterium]